MLKVAKIVMAKSISNQICCQIDEDPGSRDLTKLQDDRFLHEKHEDRSFKLVYALKF